MHKNQPLCTAEAYTYEKGNRNSEPLFGKQGDDVVHSPTGMGRPNVYRDFAFIHSRLSAALILPCVMFRFPFF